MKWLLGGPEWWSRKWEFGTRQKSPSYLAPGCLRNAVNSIPPSLPQDHRHSHSVFISVSVSLLFLTWSHPAQAIAEDTALPCVRASEWRRAVEQLNLSWFLLKAASPSQLRGLSKGYFPLVSLLKWTFRWFPGRKNLSLKDTAQIWDTPIWGHPQPEGNKGQKRLWEPDKPVRRRGSGRASTRQGRSWNSERPREEKGFNLTGTPAKSIVSSDTQLLFPRHQLERPSSIRKLHLVWGHTSAC